MNLREKVIRGSAYLAARQGIGLIIGFIGVILLTRMIGPGNYGLYVSALGIVNYIAGMTGLGLNVYIVRSENNPGIHVYNQAFTLTFMAGLTGLLVGIAIIPVLLYWFNEAAFIPPLLVMLFTLPLTSMVGPAMARLERDLNYRAVSVIELTGQLINYTFALVLACQGMGVWSPVIAYFIHQSFMLAGSCVLARFIPRPYWSWSLIKEMLGYGAGYSASIWVWQLRTLVNPLIVGRCIGPEGVGLAALAIRLADTLSFVKLAAWRLSIATFAKLRGDYPRLKKAVESAMVLQVLGLGLPLGVFAIIAPWFLPAFFGTQWDEVLIIYPFIALGYLFNSVFSMHSSLLYIQKRNWDVTLFHAAHIFLFAGGALIFVSRFGLAGYGYAEVLAFLSYIIIHFQVGRVIHLSYASAALWLSCFVPPLLATLVKLPLALFLWLPLIIVLTIPRCRENLLFYLKLIKFREG